MSILGVRAEWILHKAAQAGGQDLTGVSVAPLVLKKGFLPKYKRLPQETLTG